MGSASASAAGEDQGDLMGCRGLGFNLRTLLTNRIAPVNDYLAKSPPLAPYRRVRA